jgi:hypothetical protein
MTDTHDSWGDTDGSCCDVFTKDRETEAFGYGTTGKENSSGAV